MKKYDQADALLYDYYTTGLIGDVEFYLKEAQTAGSPVLELGCGTGRILFPIAESGITVVGLDRAPDMLSIARQKLSRLSFETQRRAELIEGDMCSFELGQHFELIMLPYHAFLHLLTPEDQRQALTCIRKHLTDDGRLVFNIFDPRLEVIAAHVGFFGAAMKKNTVFSHPDTGHSIVVWESRQYDLEHQISEQDFSFEELDDLGNVISKMHRSLALRYIYRYEMQYLLELCGYRVEALYGDFKRGPFRYGGEQIWVASNR